MRLPTVVFETTALPDAPGCPILRSEARSNGSAVCAWVPDQEQCKVELLAIHGRHVAELRSIGIPVTQADRPHDLCNTVYIRISIQTDAQDHEIALPERAVRHKQRATQADID